METEQDQEWQSLDLLRDHLQQEHDLEMYEGCKSWYLNGQQIASAHDCTRSMCLWYRKWFLEHTYSQADYPYKKCLRCNKIVLQDSNHEAKCHCDKCENSGIFCISEGHKAIYPRVQYIRCARFCSEETLTTISVNAGPRPYRHHCNTQRMDTAFIYSRLLNNFVADPLPKVLDAPNAEVSNQSFQIMFCLLRNSL